MRLNDAAITALEQRLEAQRQQRAKRRLAQQKRSRRKAMQALASARAELRHAVRATKGEHDAS